MKVLSVHNYYQQPGGEDTSARAEKELLSTAGHRVVEYVRHNDEIANYGLWQKATLAPRTVWAWDSYRQLRTLLQKEKPDLAHFQNTFPLISPAAYDACREAGVPVVQALRNYRLFCPAATFFRDGQICEECVQHSLWRSVRYACYRNSRPATATVALMLAVHRRRRTWTRQVDCYIALTEFSRRKFIEAGLPAEKIVVKPNFVHPDPRARNGRGEYALFVGRLSPEKGLHTLLDAWQQLRDRVPLRIVGDGPLRPELEAEASRRSLSNISFEGRLPRDRTLEAMKGARFLVFPSEWYETFGRTIIEAFACGVPVVASRLGAMEEIVEDGRTGLHFTPGDPDNLAAKVEWAWKHPERMEEMGRAARAEYEAKYTAKQNYRILMKIYERARSSELHKSGKKLPGHRSVSFARGLYGSMKSAGHLPFKGFLQPTIAKWVYLKGHPGFRQNWILTTLRLLTWRVHCLFGIPAVVDLPRWGMRFFLPARWRGAGATMIFATRENYELELTLLEQFLSPGKIVVDAGANCGIYTVAASKLVGDAGKVLSFEPGRESFSILRRNVELNGLRNVLAFQSALSEREGMARLYHHHHGPNSFSLGPEIGRSDQFEEVRTTTLDKVLKREGIHQVDLVKLDVEGAEELVLHGAESVLVSAHPVIIFEMSREAASRLGVPRNGAWDLLEAMEYRFFVVKGSGSLERLGSVPGGGNVVAIYKGRE